MQHQTPQQKLSTLLQIWGGVIGPAEGRLASVGLAVDYKALMKVIGELTNLHELTDILVPVKGAASDEEDGPHMPAQTKRTYERVNRPGANRQQQDESMVKMLFGKTGMQPSEGATMMRNAG